MKLTDIEISGRVALKVPPGLNFLQQLSWGEILSDFVKHCLEHGNLDDVDKCIEALTAHPYDRLAWVSAVS